MLLTVALGSLCASFLNAASNAINQIYDLEIDRLNKPGRPLVTGELSLGEAWGFTWLFYALALVPTWLVVVYPHNTLVGEAVRAAASSTRPSSSTSPGWSSPSSTRRRRWGGRRPEGMLANLTIAIPRGVLLKVAGWAMVARIWHVEPWFIGSVFGLYLIGAASTKDFADIDGDRAGGCRTLPIVHGVRRAAWMISPFFVFPWLLLPLGAFVPDPQNPEHPILTGNPWLLTVLGVALTLWGVYTVYLLVRDPDSLTSTENHPSWRHMYLMMMAAQIGFAVAYLGVGRVVDGGRWRRWPGRWTRAVREIALADPSARLKHGPADPPGGVFLPRPRRVDRFVASATRRSTLSM